MLSATKFQISSEDQESNRSRVLQDILSQSQFLDVTLVNDDREWGAHKLILSTVSPVLRRILDRGPQYHPLLYLRGAKSSNIEALLKFVYYGETSVQLADLNEFISLGNDLQLDGICEKGKEFENNENLKSEPIQTKEHSNDSHEGEFLEGVPEILANNCTLCDFRGMTAESLEKHMNLIHSRNKFQIQQENSNNDVPGRRKLKNASPVWLCAVKLSDHETQCKICNMKIKTLVGSTSNVAKHMSRHHSDDKNVIEMQRLFLEKKDNKRRDKYLQMSKMYEEGTAFDKTMKNERELINLGNELQYDGIYEENSELSKNEVLKILDEPEQHTNDCKMCDFSGITAESLEKHMNLIHN